MGTPRFAVPSLETLHRNGYPPAAVVTAPDKPRGRGLAVSPTAVKSRALTLGLPVLQPESLKDPLFIQTLSDLRPDLIVVVAFRILPPEVFLIPRLGSFNLHASLLPKYRGAAPINWAIINGETETGVTTFMLQQKVDTGGILLQERISIGKEEDAGAVHDRLSVLGAQLVLETVRRIEEGTVMPVSQTDSAATPAPKITRELCRIDWNRPARTLHNLIRGLSPVPTAFTTQNGTLLKIFRSELLSVPRRGEPGYVNTGPDWLHVSAVDYELSILDLQLEGRKRMAVGEFLRGNRLRTGEKFG